MLHSCRHQYQWVTMMWNRLCHQNMDFWQQLHISWEAVSLLAMHLRYVLAVLVHLHLALYKLFTYLQTSSLIYLLPCLFTSLRIGLFHFQAGARKMQPSLTFVFVCLFCVVVYFVTFACLLLLCYIQFFSSRPRDWLGRTSNFVSGFDSVN